MEHIIFFVEQIKELLLHVDVYLINLMHQVGPGLYWILGLIIFAETGLVVTPFLPGDSLLFAAGAVSAMPGSPIDIKILCAILWVAAVLGDFTNYSIGNFLGPKVFSKEKSLLLNKTHLYKTQNFYEKHGGRTIIIARFIPIVRTFAPFVAGVGKMNFKRFLSYSVSGGFLWIVSFSTLGHFFGNLPMVQKNFKIVILAIIGISTLPLLIEWIKHKRSKVTLEV